MSAGDSPQSPEWSEGGVGSNLAKRFTAAHQLAYMKLFAQTFRSDCE
jgi:hypothetical protein